MNEDTIPQNVKLSLEILVEKFRQYFSENLVGIYLHGSLAMGGFNSESSDIDLLIVVKNKLSLEDKKELARIILELSKNAPAKGFELSIVTLENVHNFIYPTPYEFHFSYDHKEDFETGKVDFSKDNADPDLAAHFVITKERGICLAGQPISAVFRDVPKKFYLDSIIKDSEWSYEKMIAGSDDELSLPVYGVLNFCRVLALIQEGLVTSKLEGGAWALENLPKEFNPLITETIKEKSKSGTGKGIEIRIIKKFANYAMSIIREATR